MPVRRRRLRGVPLALVRLLLLGITALTLVGLLPWPGASEHFIVELRPPLEQPLRVHYIDCGRQDAVLLAGAGGDNAVLLLGAEAPPDAVVTRYLEAAGVRELDLVVLLHGSADPAAVTAALGSLPVGRVLELTLGAAERWDLAPAGGATLQLGGPGTDLGRIEGLPIGARLQVGAANFLFTAAAGGASPGGGVWLSDDLACLGGRAPGVELATGSPSVLAPTWVLLRPAQDVAAGGLQSLRAILEQGGVDPGAGPGHGHLVVEACGHGARLTSPWRLELATGAGIVSYGKHGALWSVSRHPGAGAAWIQVFSPGQRASSEPPVLARAVLPTAEPPWDTPGGADPAGRPGAPAATLPRLQAVVLTLTPGQVRLLALADREPVSAPLAEPKGQHVSLRLPAAPAATWVLVDLSGGPPPGTVRLVADGAGTGTRLLVGAAGFRGYRFEQLGPAVMLEVDRSPLLGQVVVLDPGHGGVDAGAIGPAGTLEKDVNLLLALQLERLLSAAGASVHLTRAEDRYLGNSQRVGIANQLAADVFLSLHFNGHPVSSVAGAETFYTDNDPGSKRLALVLHAAVVQGLGLPGRYVANRPDLTLLSAAQMPATLVEPAYLTNPDQERLIANPAFRAELAAALLAGLEEYFALSASNPGGAPR